MQCILQLIIAFRVQCTEEGCSQTFTRFGDMQNHCALGIQSSDDLKFYLIDIFQHGQNGATMMHTLIVFQNMRVDKNERGKKDSTRFNIF